MAMGEVHRQAGATAIRKPFLSHGLQTGNRATVAWGLSPKNKCYLLSLGSDLPPSTNLSSLRPLPVQFQLVLSSESFSPLLSCCRIMCYRAGTPCPFHSLRNTPGAEVEGWQVENMKVSRKLVPLNHSTCCVRFFPPCGPGAHPLRV